MVKDIVGRIILFVMHVLAWGYGLLPGTLQNAFGNALGLVLRVSKWRAKIIATNLQIAYPAPTDQGQRERIFGRAYRHLGHLFLEIFLLLGPFKRYALRNCDLVGKEYWQNAKSKGKGVIFLSSHVGNWELMCASGALNGIDLLMVTKHLKPEWLHRAIEKARLQCGVRGAYEPRTLKAVLKHLQKNGTVGIVLDQYAGPPVGVRVPFLGQPVGTSTALATLARRTGATILPVVNFRTPEGRVCVQIFKPLEWIEDPISYRELALNTARYAAVIESHVREHPEEWLWTHRRFKGDLGPLESDEWSRPRIRA